MFVCVCMCVCVCVHKVHSGGRLHLMRKKTKCGMVLFLQKEPKGEERCEPHCEGVKSCNWEKWRTGNEKATKIFKRQSVISSIFWTEIWRTYFFDYNWKTKKHGEMSFPDFLFCLLMKLTPSLPLYVKINIFGLIFTIVFWPIMSLSECFSTGKSRVFIYGH